MMKQILLLVTMLLLSTSVFSAAPLLNTKTIYNFDKCDDLSVDVKGAYTIDDNEYTLVGCNETSENSWVCNCSNGYDLLLSTDIRTINNYTFLITYNYSDEIETVVDSGSRSSRSRWFFNNSELIVISKNITDKYLEDDNITIEEEYIVVENNTTIPSPLLPQPQINNTNNVNKTKYFDVPKNKPINNDIWFVVGGVLYMLAIMVYILKKD